MPAGVQAPTTKQRAVSGGINTVAQPTALAEGQSRYLLNAYQSAKIGSNVKRPGTVPVTSSPLGAAIGWLTVYRTGATDKVLVTSGTSMYKLVANALIAITGSLNNADIYDVDFTDGTSVSRKIIADLASLKAYNSATDVVAAITPAVDDPPPNPVNILSTVNALGIKYCFSYQGHVFVSDGSDAWWYTKRFTFDYIPSVQKIRWVKGNDFVNGPGFAFDNVCLLPMRRAWGMLTGDKFDNFQGNLFLNTNNGVAAPRTPARLTYPNGVQTIAFVSDDGVYEIYDTGSLDTGSRRYSARSLTVNKLDFLGIGLSSSELAAGIGYFDANLNLYIIKFNRGSERLAYAYDVRNGEWYPWNNIKANAFIRSGDLLYSGETGHIHKFDVTLGSDWNESTKTTGTPIDWDMITDMIPFEETGHMSTLDYLIVQAKQFSSKSSIDVWVTFYSTQSEVKNAISNQYMVWEVTPWDTAVWANLNFTDLMGALRRLIFHKKSFYFQIRMRNNRDELAEVYGMTLIGRGSGLL